MKKELVEEFLSEGYLQEANRLFFHPLGLALTLVFDDQGDYSSMHIQDFREDEAGIIFDPTWLNSREGVEKMNIVERTMKAGLAKRESRFGFGIQPVTLPSPDTEKDLDSAAES